MASGVSSGGGSLFCGALKTTTSANAVQSVNEPPSDAEFGFTEYV